MRHLSLFRNIILPILAICLSAFSQSRTTIHLQHPWLSDAARAATPPWVISSETGWYPGVPMQAEGGNWYTYTFAKLNRTTNDRVEFASYLPDEYNRYNNPLRYPTTQQLVFLKLFEGSPSTVNELWIIPGTGGAAPKILFTPPPGGKVICMLNRWELGAPRIIINDLGIATMRQDKRKDRCGWFLYSYYGDTGAACARIMNSLDSAIIGKNGAGDTECVNLVSVFSTSDTAWIYQKSAADSLLSISAKYPGINGECGKEIHLAALMRDIGIHPDFGTYTQLEADSCGGLQRGMVEKKLGTNGKPVKKTHRCKMIHSQFDWFDTRTFPSGFTNETCYDMTLTKNEEGLYSYDTDKFFPLDSFIYLDPAKTIRNPNNNLYIEGSSPPPANVHFTMELSAQFDYHKGQTFYFRGDDDVWVFIDSQLVVDLGGNHGPEEGSVKLDALGLIPGSTYSFNLFFTERNCCGSNFLMQTSLNLRTSSRLFSVKTTPAPGQIQLSMFERLSRYSLACDQSESDIDTVDATATFKMTGPQMAEFILLPSGLSYGGIYISEEQNIITVDTGNITGLSPGIYTVVALLSGDFSQMTSFTFTVIAKPKPPAVKNPVISASYFTDNGRGQVTRAEIYFTNELVKAPDSLQLYWPEPLQQFLRTARAASEIIIDPANRHHLTVKPAIPFDTILTRNKGTNFLGTSFIYDTTFAEPSDIAQFTIADSIGPLLLSAVHPERQGSGLDTFLLTFSERVTDSLIIGTSLAIKHIDGNETLLDILSFARRLDTMFIFVPALPSAPLSTDSMRIVAMGPLTDIFQNHAHPLNRAVSIVNREQAGKIITAWYLDRNADGIIDTVSFLFDRPVNIDSCIFSLTFDKSTTDGTIPQNHLSVDPAAPTIINCKLYGTLLPPLTLATSGTMNYLYSNDDASSASTTGSAADSAAPVIVSASFHPAIYFSASVASAPDTLKITFSEPVKMPLLLTPVVISKAGPVIYSPPLTVLYASESAVTFLAHTPFPEAMYPENGDSVSINVVAGVSDLYGNIQHHARNRRAILTVAEVIPHFRISAGPNPFSPPLQNISFIVDPFVKSKGSATFTFNYCIYDKTGLVVAEKQWPSDRPPSSVKDTLLWNGTNRHGRFVGDGTYLVFVNIFDRRGNRIYTEADSPLLIAVRK